MARGHVGVSGNALTAMGNFGGGLGGLAQSYLTPEGIAARKKKEEEAKLSAALDTDAQKYLDNLRNEAMLGPTGLPFAGGAPAAPPIPGMTASVPPPAPPAPMAPPAPPDPMTAALDLAKPFRTIPPKYGSWQDIGGPAGPAKPTIPGATMPVPGAADALNPFMAGVRDGTTPMAENPRYFRPAGASPFPKGDAPVLAGADSLQRERDAMDLRARQIPLDRWGMVAFRQPQMAPSLGREAVMLAGQDDPFAIAEDQQRLGRMATGEETDIGRALTQMRSRVGRSAAIDRAQALADEKRKTTAAAAEKEKERRSGLITEFGTADEGAISRMGGRQGMGLRKTETTAGARGQKEDPEVVASELNDIANVSDDEDALLALAPSTKSSASARLRAVMALRKAKGAYDPSAERDARAMQAQAHAFDAQADRIEKDLRVRYPEAFDSRFAGMLDPAVQSEVDAAMVSVKDFRDKATAQVNAAAERFKRKAAPVTTGRWQDDPEAARIRDDAAMTPEQKRAALEALKAKYAAPR